jgi:pantetheine-phosphate adenylyltransferase
MADIAIFPGSFDPFTLGHQDIVLRAAKLFDKVVVAIGYNTSKNYLLQAETRLYIAQQVFDGDEKVEVMLFDSLTVDLCSRLGARYIVRGLRSGTDFDYERNIAMMNASLNRKVETIFLISNPSYAGLTSTIVREIYKYGGDISGFVPEAALPFLGRQ